MKKTIKLIVLLFVMIASAGSAIAENTVKIVSSPWPPYLIDNNSGFDVEITKAVFKNIGYTADIELMSWNRAVKLSEDKKADGLLVIQNEVRKKTMYFPEEHSTTSEVVFFSKKGMNFEYSGLESLTSKKVGILTGYKYSDEFDDADNFTREATDKLEFNFKKLLAGRLDLMVAYRAVGLHVAKEIGLADQVEYSKGTISSNKWYLGFVINPGNEELSKKFSDALKSFKATAEHTAIKKKYGM